MGVIKKGVASIVDISLTGAAVQISAGSNVPLGAPTRAIIAAGLLKRQARRSGLLKKKNKFL